MIIFGYIIRLSELRSKDPVRQVGACIVDTNNRIVGIGYNGLPRGCEDTEYSWNKGDGLDNKHLYVVHGEVNALMNTNGGKVEGCRIYVSLFPCNECVKLLIQSGIKEVIYLEDTKKGRVSNTAAKRMLDSVNISYRKLGSDIVSINLSI